MSPPKKEDMDKTFVNNLIDDDFYYGEVRESVISASSINSILDGSFGEPQQHKAVFEIGKYFHVQTLEPEKLDKFDVRDNSRRKAGETHLKQQEVEMCEAMKLSHDKHIEARGILYGPEVQYEVPGYTIIEDVLFIGKADIVNPMIGWLGDLKSTGNLEGFDQSIRKWYTAQLWLYYKIFNLPTAYITVDKKGDNETQVIYPPKYFYADGKSKVLEAIEVYKQNYPEHYKRNLELQSKLKQ